MSDISRLIRERALAVLRDTRAKIDPALLDAMKERLSGTAPKTAPVNRPKQEKQGSSVPSDSEPVDRQKIQEVVLNYMKNREKGTMQ